MSKVLVEDTSLTAIGDALRSKLGETHKEYYDELVGYQDILRTFYTKNADPVLRGGYISGAYPETSLTQTFTFEGATQIQIQHSGCGASGSTTLTYSLDGDSFTTMSINYGTANASYPSLYTNTFDTNTITIKWTTSSTSTYYHFYMEIVPYDAEGNILQEPVYETKYNEVKNEYKPAEMSSTIISTLDPKEELITTNITYTSSYNTTLNLSNYVKDYSNIRRIVFSGGGSGVICIYDNTIYQQNQEAGSVRPCRLYMWSKDSSSGYAMASLKSPLPASTNYYYFDEEEWKANGALTLYSYNGSSISSLSYARYGKMVQVIYKKED